MDASGLRSLPSVDELLQTPRAVELVGVYGRPLTLEAIRDTLADLRSRYPHWGKIPDLAMILDLAGERLAEWSRPTLVMVINATGVLLHTNLGRAPLSKAAARSMQDAALGYSTLEFDLGKGGRGSRHIHTEALLKRLTGAEAALVVNNNAAAVLLALTALANRRRVIIARTQLIEIGGGFRIPDVMKQSGARLVEVGTTNRVHPKDYETALEQAAALIMRAHSSNFKIIGFTTEPDLAELVGIAHRHGIPLVDDLGSGALLETAAFGLGHEPMVQESIQAGADLVCFSGDKLLGGPQAGIIVGRQDLVARLRKHPLARAVRPDKLCLAALTATLLHYIKDEAEREIPLWRMMAMSLEQIYGRAVAWMQALGTGDVIEGRSTVGGGSLPEETLPTCLLALPVPQPNRFMAALRSGNPPVIARIEADQVVFDPRTVGEEEEAAMLDVVKRAMERSKT